MIADDPYSPSAFAIWQSKMGAIIIASFTSYSDCERFCTTAPNLNVMLAEEIILPSYHGKHRANS